MLLSVHFFNLMEATDKKKRYFGWYLQVDVIYDTLDPNIYVASPELLALFSDNFDIQGIVEDGRIKKYIYIYIW